jgi:hypothetical protein
MDEHLRDDPPVLHHRHVEDRSRADRGEGGGAVRRSRVGDDVGDRDRRAGPQVLGIGPVIAEPMHAGDVDQSRHAPVALDRDGAGIGVEHAIAHAIGAQHLAEELGGGIGEPGGVGLVAQAIVEFQQGLAPPLGQHRPRRFGADPEDACDLAAFIPRGRATDGEPRLLGVTAAIDR